MCLKYSGKYQMTFEQNAFELTLESLKIKRHYVLRTLFSKLQFIYIDKDYVEFI